MKKDAGILAFAFLVVLALGVFFSLNAPIKGKIVWAGKTVESPAFIREDINKDEVFVLNEGKYLASKRVVVFYSTSLSKSEVETKMIEDGWELY
jgi:hypothetical protein